MSLFAVCVLDMAFSFKITKQNLPDAACAMRIAYKQREKIQQNMNNLFIVCIICWHGIL